MTSSAFQPDWVSAPGETIADILKQRHVSQAEFARSMGRREEQIHELLLGQEEIDEEIARKLELAIGGSVPFWLARERSYREGLRDLKRRTKEPAAANWMAELPLNDMMALGWLPKADSLNDKLIACLKFFGVQDTASWRAEYESLLGSAVFRTSDVLSSKPGAVVAWLRQAEIQSEGIVCKPWNPDGLQQALHEVRVLTRKEGPNVFISELRKCFAEYGVAVVVLRAPSGCRASGATRFLTPNKALMVLSFRYLSDDQFWFSVFHEAAHLLLHGKTSVFVESPETPRSKQEEEANQFAAESLIPPQFKSEMLNLPVDGRKVMRFAKKIGVSPGIVVGQLQHFGRLTHRQLNNLKRRFRWED